MGQAITKRSLELAVMQRREKMLALMPDHVVDKEKFLKKLAVEVELMVHRNVALSKCGGASLMLAAMEAARHRLSFSHGDCSIIPFKSKGGYQAVFVLGAPGIAKVLYRTGMFNRIEWETVRERDTFKAVQGSNQNVVFEKAYKNRGEIVCAYALAEMKDGTEHIYVMDYDTLMKVRGTSPGGGGTYEKWPDEMYSKAPMKRLFKRLPIDPDVHEQIKAVSDVIESDNTYQDVDNQMKGLAEAFESVDEDGVVEEIKTVNKPSNSGPTEEEMAALSQLAQEAEQEALKLQKGNEENRRD
jgi:phage RecT family recombinase